MKILILQTAFIGDVVLATPLIEAATKRYPEAEISFLTIPYSAPVLRNHPGLKRIIVFEKRGRGGFRNTLSIVKELKREKYDLAIVPHRSFRSAAMVSAAGITKRVGFDKSAGKFLLTEAIEYRNDWHEVKRNLSLLGMQDEDFPPGLYPGEAETEKAIRFLKKNGIEDACIAIAPGSIWNTKRWLEHHFQDLLKSMKSGGLPPVVLVGSSGERKLSEEIAGGLEGYAFVAAGILDPLQSAALLKNAGALIANDNAAGHIAAAVGTKVVTVFGPTIPGFGFAPFGEGHRIVEHPGLYCRPCRIHGSGRCPEKHFRCMLELKPERVLETLMEIIQ